MTSKIITVEEAKTAFESTDWEELEEQLKAIITKHPSLSVYDVNEPGTNLWNTGNQAEMHIGFFGKDFFELLLTTFPGGDGKMVTHNKKGLSASDASKAIAFFYAGDYVGIEGMISSSGVRNSQILKELEDREKKTVAAQNRNGWQMLAILFAIILALVCWLLYTNARG